eukprot:6565146-Pyramimonas_sp.AAC.1
MVLNQQKYGGANGVGAGCRGLPAARRVRARKQAGREATCCSQRRPVKSSCLCDSGSCNDARVLRGPRRAGTIDA